MSLLGVKRTLLFAAHMSAYDLKWHISLVLGDLGAILYADR